MYYSVYDNDIGEFLHTGRNSKTKREALEDYISYRFPDLLDILKETFNITDEQADSMTESNYIQLLDDGRIIDDMVCCNFELREHKGKMVDDDSPDGKGIIVPVNGYDRVMRFEYPFRYWKDDTEPAKTYSDDPIPKPETNGLYVRANKEHDKFFLPF